MKILFIDVSLSGHRVGYLKALMSNYDNSIALLPENCNELKCKQIIMTSNYNRVRRLSTYIKWINEISEIANKEHIDVVHFLCGDALYRFFGIGLSKIKQKVVVTYHHMLFNPLRDLSYKRIYKASSVGVVHTDSLNASLKQIGINNSMKIEYPVFEGKFNINKSIARELFGLPQNKKVLLALGGISKYKGLDILLEAMKKVDEACCLFIAGNPSSFTEDYIKEQIISYKDSVVLNLHRLSDDEYAQAIAASDILVLPYRYEFDGASGPMTEGVWNRKYIIGAGHGSMGDLIRKHELGATFETENSYDLARVINQVLSSGIQWSDKAETFRDMLTVDSFLRAYYDVYNM